MNSNASVAACLLGVLISTTATAEGRRPLAKRRGPNSQEICIQARTTALEHEKGGQLREAKESMLLCAKPECGESIGKECRAGLVRLDDDIPSVVPLATVGSKPLVHVSVAIDGAPLTPELDGRAHPIDPGLHRFSFTTSGRIVAEKEVMVGEGQRNLPISVRVSRKYTLQEPGLAAPKESPPPSPHRSFLPYVVGGGGIVAAGAGALLYSWGRRDNGELGSCAPECSPSEVSHIRALYAVGDTAMGVGALAIGFAAWQLFTPTSHGDTGNKTAFGFGVQPVKNGAFASIGRVF